MVLWPIFDRPVFRGASSLCLGCLGRFLWTVRVVIRFVRAGEAVHPGPADAFVLGAANPTGLRDKAHFVASHMAHGDMWAFNANHLSSKEVQSLNAGCRFAQSFMLLVAGHLGLCRKDNVGQWKEVAALAKSAVWYQLTCWPDVFFASPRALDFTPMVAATWITGGLVYGESASCPYPHRLGEVVSVWNGMPPLFGPPHGDISWSGAPVGRQLMTWFWNALHGPLGSAVRVAKALVFIDLVRTTGPGGSVQLHGWKAGSTLPTLGLRPSSSLVLVPWFAKVLKVTMKHAAVPVLAHYIRSLSVMVVMQVGFVALLWPTACLDDADGWMRSKSQKPFHRPEVAMDRLPMLQLMPSFLYP